MLNPDVYLNIKTNKTMKNAINQIVTEALNQAKMEASSYDRAANLSDVSLEINIMVDSIKFDTITAKNMFLGFCFTELRKVAPILYPAKMAMDMNGNYTSNSNLWA